VGDYYTSATIYHFKIHDFYIILNTRYLVSMHEGVLLGVHAVYFLNKIGEMNKGYYIFMFLEANITKKYYRARQKIM
jgi:hypothetical protein